MANKIKKVSNIILKKIKYSIGKKKRQVTFANQTIELNMNWKHEQDYYEYIVCNKTNGPIAIDAWVYSQFVKENNIVLDAGANIGFTALLALKFKASEIHCFEPDPRLTDKLKSNCKGEHFYLYNSALSAEPGTMQLCLSSTHNQGSTLSSKMINKFPQIFKNSEKIDIAVDTIDIRFGNKLFDFFKLDIEGAELQALQGASSMLKNNPPKIIYIEMYDEFFEEVHTFLTQFYKYTYRIVCDSKGNGKLFALNTNVSEMQKQGYYVNPPSYIYSASPQDHYTKAWTSAT